MGRKRLPAHKKKRMPKGTRSGKQLSDMEKEMVLQAYAICGNQREVARQFKISPKTVYNVLHQAKTDTKLQKARSNAVQELAGKVHGKSLELLESITPVDFESGFLEIHDNNGNVIRRQYYGPSLMQKTTSFAILVDKEKVLLEMQNMLEQDNVDAQGMPLPGDVNAALQRIGQQIKRLRILDVQFDNKHEDVAAKVQEVAQAAALQEEAEDAEYDELNPFDNPS